MLRPQRGSRTRLITGAQYVEYALPAFMKARASTPICLPVAFHRERLKDPAVVMGSAKFVSVGVDDDAPSRTWDMPCVASLHQLYAFNPSDGSASAFVPSELIFSLRLKRATASAARTSIASV